MAEEDVGQRRSDLDAEVFDQGPRYVREMCGNCDKPIGFFKLRNAARLCSLCLNRILKIHKPDEVRDLMLFEVKRILNPLGPNKDNLDVDQAGTGTTGTRTDREASEREVDSGSKGSP